jgi:hypothetical protein
MMISWRSKHVGVILSVLMCDIWINVLLQTSALVGPLHTVNWNARWNSEKLSFCPLIKDIRGSVEHTCVCVSIVWLRMKSPLNSEIMNYTAKQWKQLHIWEVQGYCIQYKIHSGTTQLSCQQCSCAKGRRRCCAGSVLLRFEKRYKAGVLKLWIAVCLSPPPTILQQQLKRADRNVPAGLKILNVWNFSFNTGTKNTAT